MARNTLARLNGMTTPTILEGQNPIRSTSGTVGGLSRLLDLLAVCALIAGVSLFAYGRASLSAIADGSYSMPEGTTHVAQTERHDAQTKQGLWIIGAGLGIALLSAAQHAIRRRRPSE